MRLKITLPVSSSLLQCRAMPQIGSRKQKRLCCCRETDRPRWHLAHAVPPHHPPPPHRQPIARRARCCGTCTLTTVGRWEEQPPACSVAAQVREMGRCLLVQVQCYPLAPLRLKHSVGAVVVGSRPGAGGKCSFRRQRDLPVSDNDR